MSKYIISIIIPTKNRQKYCLAAIKQILDLSIDGVEICVQDNSDTNCLKGAIAEFANENIVYNYHSGTLSFVDNFSEAVCLAHGEYLCMIGDDDGILPSIKDIVYYAKINGVDSVIPSLDCVYYWPSDHPIVDEGERGVLSVIRRKKRIRIANPNKALNKLLKNAVQEYTSLEIPRLYHGIVRRDCIDRIKRITGTYFDGLTPDMYMAVALCFVCQNTVRLSFPITISGICPTSGSTDSATGKHTGKLSDAPHFRGHALYHWDSIIPEFYSVDTIWAETLMKALNEFNEIRKKDLFNLPLFELLCTEKYPEFREIILKHANSYGISRSKMILHGIKYKLSLLPTRISRILQPDRKCNYVGITDISEACELYMNYYGE